MIIGIVLTVIIFAWIPLVMLPMILMGGFNQQQVQDDIQMNPEPTVQMIPDSVPTPILVLAPSAEGDRVMAAEPENSCDE